MNCATSTLKVMVFVFNVLCSIVGLVTVAVSAVAMGSLHHQHLAFCTIGIVVGVVAFLVASFGCCGAQRESPGYMWTYATLLAILLVAQLAIVLVFHSKDFVQVGVAQVDQLWAQELKSPGAMAAMETQFKCCGLHSPQDYVAANMTIPASCYRQTEDGASRPCDDGCRQKIATVYGYAAKVVKVTNWTLCGIEGIGIVFACILAHSFKQQSLRYMPN